MAKEFNIWTYEQPQEVFLCIAESPKTASQIVEETGYPQPKVSLIMNELKKECLIVSLDKKIRTKRRPQTAWEINPEMVFGKMIAKKGYAHGEFKHIVKEFKLLPTLVAPYLKTIAKHPLWRCNHCNNKDISDWDAYKKSKKTKFNLSTVGDYFIDYLLVNNRRLNDTQKKELNEFIWWIRLSGDQLLLHYLQDKSL